MLSPDSDRLAEITGVPLRSPIVLPESSGAPRTKKWFSCSAIVLPAKAGFAAITNALRYARFIVCPTRVGLAVMTGAHAFDGKGEQAGGGQP